MSQPGRDGVDSADVVAAATARTADDSSRAADLLQRQRHAEQAAQAAAEARLEVLGRVQCALMDGDEPEDDDMDVLAGPCCEGCDTCTVREILDAAWPHLLELARAEVELQAQP